MEIAEMKLKQATDEHQASTTDLQEEIRELKLQLTGVSEVRTLIEG